MEKKFVVYEMTTSGAVVIGYAENLNEARNKYLHSGGWRFVCDTESCKRVDSTTWH